MTRRFGGLLGLVLVAALVSCGGTNGTTDESPGTDLFDPGPAVDPGTPEDATDEGQDRDVDGTVTTDPGETVEDVPVDTAQPDIPPQPGEFGYPCGDNQECDSRFCIDSPKGKVCTKLCVQDCPFGWTCSNVQVGTDTLSICVPLYLNLCDPCNDNKDCNTSDPASGTITGGTSICIDGGQGVGSFCGGDCSQSLCPDGYACQDVSDGTGGTAKQCVPTAGECTCSTRAIKLGLSTECFQAGPTGRCTGERKCVMAGLTKCDAAIPKAEECNGFDDDCNGLTDELQGKFPCEKTNQFGTCPGQGDCINGSVANCDAAVPVPESCNGMDDNCNDQTDEELCYDGNDCTKDLCDPGSLECVFEPIAGPCNDGNPCTVNDHCDKATSTCLGGAQKNCDDGNPCTDDSCDTGSGDCIHLNNVAPCVDSDPCTLNDRCENGVCKTGNQKDCNDDNPCMVNKHCDSKTGLCVGTPNDGAPCDDENPCTKNDVCSGGKCIGPKDYCDGQVCTPTPPQVGCLAPKCVTIPIVQLPSCPCVCI